MTHLEELLGECESAQATLSQALSQIVGRQATIDAVEAQVTRVFEVAERSAQDIKAISTAKRDVEGARALLDDMQERLTKTGSAMEDFAERKKQVERLEQRVARADAIARDVKATVELLSAQRVVLDQVLERSGMLAMQTKQVESLIESLRAECTMATTLERTIKAQRTESNNEE
jgi:chromosome segregation ATPase